MRIGRNGWLLGLVSALVLLSVASGAQVPTTIGYNGVLLKDGVGFSHAGLTMTFRLFKTKDAVEADWWETQTVPVDAGFYHADLGSTDPQKAIELRLLVTGECWLEVDPDGIGPLVPRILLSSVPFAWESGRSAEAGRVEIASGGSRYSVNAVFRGTTEGAPAVVGQGSFGSAGHTTGAFEFESRTGYQAAKLACEAALGSRTAHMCTVSEMLTSYQMGLVDIPEEVYAWVASGTVDYFRMEAGGGFYYHRDCEGYTKGIHIDCPQPGYFCNGVSCGSKRCVDQGCSQGLPIACCDHAS